MKTHEDLIFDFRFFKAADADGDGMLSLAEALKQNMKQELFNTIDTDGNGQITDKEFYAWERENEQFWAKSPAAQCKHGFRKAIAEQIKQSYPCTSQIRRAHREASLAIFESLGNHELALFDSRTNKRVPCIFAVLQGTNNLKAQAFEFRRHADPTIAALEHADEVEMSVPHTERSEWNKAHLPCFLPDDRLFLVKGTNQNPTAEFVHGPISEKDAHAKLTAHDGLSADGTFLIWKKANFDDLILSTVVVEHVGDAGHGNGTIENHLLTRTTLTGTEYLINGHRTHRHRLEDVIKWLGSVIEEKDPQTGFVWKWKNRLNEENAVLNENDVHGRRASRVRGEIAIQPILSNNAILCGKWEISKYINNGSFGHLFEAKVIAGDHLRISSVEMGGSSGGVVIVTAGPHTLANGSEVHLRSLSRILVRTDFSTSRPEARLDKKRFAVRAIDATRFELVDAKTDVQMFPRAELQTDGYDGTGRVELIVGIKLFRSSTDRPTTEMKPLVKLDDDARKEMVLFHHPLFPMTTDHPSIMSGTLCYGELVRTGSQVPEVWQPRDMFFVEMALGAADLVSFLLAGAIDRRTGLTPPRLGKSVEDLSFLLPPVSHDREAVVRHLFRQLSAGIAHMHKHGMCHRDLKAENILISKQFTLQIIDFGSGKFLDGWSPEEQGRVMTDASPDKVQQARRQTQTRTGTERTRRDDFLHGSEMYDPMAVDVYACGLCLLQLVVGTLTAWLPSSKKQRELLSGPGENLNFRTFWSYPGHSCSDTRVLVCNISGRSTTITKELKHLIEMLLHPNATERITAAAICNHPFFRNGGHEGGADASAAADMEAYLTEMRERCKFVP
jgi:hypothetical protein